MTTGQWRAPETVWAGVLVLALGAAVAVAASGPSAARERKGAAFQAAVGGLGLGRAADLTRCAGAFDPRTGGRCDLRYHALPSTEAVCPDHAMPPLDAPR